MCYLHSLSQICILSLVLASSKYHISACLQNWNNSGEVKPEDSFLVSLWHVTTCTYLYFILEQEWERILSISCTESKFVRITTELSIIFLGHEIAYLYLVIVLRAPCDHGWRRHILDQKLIIKQRNRNGDRKVHRDTLCVISNLLLV